MKFQVNKNAKKQTNVFVTRGQLNCLLSDFFFNRNSSGFKSQHHFSI